MALHQRVSAEGCSLVDASMNRDCNQSCRGIVVVATSAYKWHLKHPAYLNSNITSPEGYS